MTENCRKVVNNRPSRVWDALADSIRGSPFYSSRTPARSDLKRTELFLPKHPQHHNQPRRSSEMDDIFFKSRTPYHRGFGPTISATDSLDKHKSHADLIRGRLASNASFTIPLPDCHDTCNSSNPFSNLTSSVVEPFRLSSVTSRFSRAHNEHRFPILMPGVSS